MACTQKLDGEKTLQGAFVGVVVDELGSGLTVNEWLETIVRSEGRGGAE